MSTTQICRSYEDFACWDEGVDGIHDETCNLNHSACLETRLTGLWLFFFTSSLCLLTVSFLQILFLMALVSYEHLVRPRASRVLGEKTLKLNCLKINSAVSFSLFVPARFSGAAQRMFIHKVNIHVRCFVYKNAKPRLRGPWLL